MIHLTFHRPVLPEYNQTNAGGGSTVVDDLRHTTLNERKNLTLVTADPHDGEVDDIVVKACDSEPKWMGPLRTDYLFANTWLTLFNQSYTAPSLPQDYLDFMYGGEKEGLSPVGSIKRLREFIALNSPSSQVEAEFVNRYDRPLKEIPTGSTLRWNDFCFAPHIVKYSEFMRSRNVSQTWHIHTSIPGEHLSDFDWGIKFLKAASLVDTVFVHTDELKRVLEKHLSDLNFTIPEIRRFDLGTNGNKILSHLAKIDINNYKSTIPGFDALKETQKDFIDKVLIQDRDIPHRFMSVCRFDPVKGLDTIVEAIGTFLEQEARGGKDIEKLYRFYFVSNVFFDTANKYAGDNLSQGYAIYVTQKFNELQEKYPNIVRRCDAFTGEQRVVLPVLMRGCHGMTGGREDGLNLALQEFSWVNQDKPVTLIAGSGAGLVQHIIETGYGDTGYYFAPNQPEHFVNAFRDISRHSPESILSMKRGLFEKIISTRNDSIAFPTFHD